MTPPAFGPGPVLSLTAPRPYGGESHNKRRTCAATLLCADFDTPHRVPLLCGIFDVPEPKSLWIHDKLYASHRQKANKKNRLQTPQIQYIIARTLGHSLTVELRTLTPSVLVRIQLPQPPFASATMRWQAEAEQFTRRSATRSFNEVWQTHFIFTIPPNGGFNFWFVTMVQSCNQRLPVRKQVDLTITAHISYYQYDYLLHRPLVHNPIL